MTDKPEMKQVHDKIVVPSADHDNLELLKLKADAINDNLIRRADNCILFRIPAGEDQDVTFAEHEFAVEVYNDRGLPFKFYLEPWGSFEVIPKRFNKDASMGVVEEGDENVVLCPSGDKETSLGYLSWNYVENTVTFIPPVPGAKMGKNVMTPSCNPQWTKERLAEFEATGK